MNPSSPFLSGVEERSFLPGVEEGSGGHQQVNPTQNKLGDRQQLNGASDGEEVLSKLV